MMDDGFAMLDAEEEILNLEEEADDDDDKNDNSDDKLNSSSNSLDKYVGKGKNSKYMTLLPEGFEPGDMDVLCGRGKRCFNSPGNQCFRKLVAARAEDYAAATTRTDKTFIVCSIVSEVRKASPKGGFVKKDSTTGRWYEVGDFNAHEKTSQMFRDVLHESYLSSNKSKKKRRDLFRTNSKRRALIQQHHVQQKSMNASSARFLRHNGVGRHHSYDSVRVGGQQVSLLKMRQQQQARLKSEHTNSSRAESWQNDSHSSWQNSWKSESVMMGNGNPRSWFASRGRENSLDDLSGSIGELRNPDAQFHSIGELRNPDAAQFHNSIGDLRFDNSFGEYQAQDNFHQSCGEFHNSFGEFNTGGLLAPSNNMMMENNNSFNDSNQFGNSADFHNSFGEYVNNDARARARAIASPSHMMMNLHLSEPRSQQVYRRANSGHYSDTGYAAAGLIDPDYDSLDLQPPSVPLSISVPADEYSSRNIEREQFQLEFEDDNIGNGQRHPGNPGLSIVDALDTAGYSNQNEDGNPFEPVPVTGLPDMQRETIF